MDELKKCPFCGDDASMYTATMELEKKPRYRIRCNNCWCATEWDNWSADEVIGKWNRRVNDDSAL